MIVFRQDMDLLLHELRSERFFDVFEYNGVEQQWGCFLCNHPDRAKGFVEVRSLSALESETKTFLFATSASRAKSFTLGSSTCRERGFDCVGD